MTTTAPITSHTADPAPALAEATPTDRLTPLPPADAYGITTAEQRAQAHPVLGLLTGWTWQDWKVPGPAADHTLIGYRVTDGVLVAVFIQTEDTATARWTTLHECREIAVVHGSVADVIAHILQDQP